MAVFAQTAVEETSGVSVAQRAVSQIDGEDWRRFGRRDRAGRAERALAPVWVARAKQVRIASLLEASAEAEAPGIDAAQVGRLRALVSRLPLAWATTATRMYLKLWTTSHRLHDRGRDRCYVGCDAADSLALHSLHAPAFYRRDGR